MKTYLACSTFEFDAKDDEEAQKIAETNDWDLLDIDEELELFMLQMETPRVH